MFFFSKAKFFLVVACLVAIAAQADASLIRVRIADTSLPGAAYKTVTGAGGIVSTTFSTANWVIIIASGVSNGTNQLVLTVSATRTATAGTRTLDIWLEEIDYPASATYDTLNSTINASLTAGSGTANTWADATNAVPVLGPDTAGTAGVAPLVVVPGTAVPAWGGGLGFTAPGVLATTSVPFSDPVGLFSLFSNVTLNLPSGATGTVIASQSVTAAVPEPGSIALVSGLLSAFGLGAWRRRRRNG